MWVDNVVLLCNGCDGVRGINFRQVCVFRVRDMEMARDTERVCVYMCACVCVCVEKVVLAGGCCLYPANLLPAHDEEWD